MYKDTRLDIANSELVSVKGEYVLLGLLDKNCIEHNCQAYGSNIH